MPKAVMIYYINPTKYIGVVQSQHHFLIECTCSRHDMAEKLLNIHSLTHSFLRENKLF
jgi:hypothetical protein